MSIFLNHRIIVMQEASRTNRMISSWTMFTETSFSWGRNPWELHIWKSTRDSITNHRKASRLYVTIDDVIENLEEDDDIFKILKYMKYIKESLREIGIPDALDLTDHDAFMFQHGNITQRMINIIIKHPAKKAFRLLNNLI